MSSWSNETRLLSIQNDSNCKNVTSSVQQYSQSQKLFPRMPRVGYVCLLFCSTIQAEFIII